jgi:hypothetical protein
VSVSKPRGPPVRCYPLFLPSAAAPTIRAATRARGVPATPGVGGGLLMPTETAFYVILFPARTMLLKMVVAVLSSSPRPAAMLALMEKPSHAATQT